jgi:hypothetical protein
MPRNGSGTYSLPAGNPVVTLTNITSSWANSTLSDIGTELTNSIDKLGRTAAAANLPMGGFKHTGAAAATAAGQYLTYGQTSAGFADGTAAAPSVTFASDPNTGLYRAAADDLGFSAGGTGRMRLSTTKLNLGSFVASPNLADALPANTYAVIDRIGGGTAVPLTVGTILTLIGAAAAGSPSYLQLISGNGSAAEVRFGDTDAALRGGIGFDHANERLRLWSQGSESMHLTPGGISLGDIGAGNYFSLVPGAGGGLQRIDALAAAGSVNMDISPIPGDGVSSTRVGLFRSTNTAGSKTLQLFRGNGSGTTDHVFTTGAAGALADLCRNGGYARVGTTGSASAARMHLASGASGQAAPSVSADELVIENSANAGISILTPSANIGYLLFGDEASPTVGQLSYNHATDVMALVVAGAARMSVAAASVTMASGVELILSDALSTSALDAGYKGSPVVDRNATQNFASTDSGKTIRHTNTTAYTWTIAPDATTDFPIGTIISLFNDSGTGAVAIARGAGVVLVDGAGTDANQTLAVRASASVQKVAANRWRWLA